MGRASNARILTILGIISNGLVAAVAFSWHTLGLFTVFIGTIPHTFFLLSLSVAIGFLLFATICGVILPIWAYRHITPDGKAKASTLLFISGVFSLFISIIGGILLLIAGLLTTYWNPLTEP